MVLESFEARIINLCTKLILGVDSRHSKRNYSYPKWIDLVKDVYKDMMKEYDFSIRINHIFFLVFNYVKNSE